MTAARVFMIGKRILIDDLAGNQSAAPGAPSKIPATRSGGLARSPREASPRCETEGSAEREFDWSGVKVGKAHETGWGRRAGEQGGKDQEPEQTRCEAAAGSRRGQGSKITAGIKAEEDDLAPKEILNERR